MVTLVPVNEEDAQPLTAAPQAKLVPVAPEDAAGAEPMHQGQEPTWGGFASELASTLGRKAAIAVHGAREGVENMVSIPFDLANGGIGLLGGGHPIPTPRDFGDTVLSAPVNAAAAVNHAVGGTTDLTLPKPENMGERILDRVGQEFGAATTIAGPIIGLGRSMGVEAASAMAKNAPSMIERLFGRGLQAGAVNPVGTAVREGKYAAAAGTGAGVANEAADQAGEKGFWSDLVGSLLGVGTLGGVSKIASGAQKIASPVIGGQKYIDGLVQEDVANNIIANSTHAQAHVGKPNTYDTGDLVDALRTPSTAENVIPGYQSNIGDRTLDPGLQTFAFNVDGGPKAGVRNSRAVNNENAVNTEVARLAPSGDPALFRDALERSRTQELGAADTAAQQAQQAFDTLQTQLAPVMHESSARGTEARAALAEAYQNVQDATNTAYARVRDGRVRVPMDDLAARFRTITDALPRNDRERFLPSEAELPGTMVDEATEAGRNANVPFNEVQAIRSGLTDTARAARATPGQQQAARIADMFRTATDAHINENLPPRLRERYDTANAARRDQANRFERPGTALRDILQTREGGGYRMDDSAVTGRLTPTDAGKVGDFRTAMQEAGNDPRLRNALQDELLADVQRRGLANNPAALQHYLGERNVVLSEFPDLRARLEQTGAARQTATDTAATADATRRELTTPSQSATAKYLQYGDVATHDAMKAVVASKDPVPAVRELVQRAGNDPATLQNAKAAFWTLVSKKKYKAPGVTGNPKWDAGAVRQMFEDPKTASVARELWSDAPQELAQIEDLFSVLSRAEGSTRARSAGSSGTGQIMKGGDPGSLSGASIMSRFRSMKEGRTSSHYFVTSIAGEYLRRARVAMSKDAIDRITAEAVNNPGLAADLLEKYNPATFDAKRRMIGQKYGMRASAVINFLDDTHDEAEDPVAAVAAPPKSAARKPGQKYIYDRVPSE